MITASAAASKSLEPLISLNREWLRQAEELVQRLSHEHYTAPSPALAPQRVSAHIRHIIEFYECFFDGLSPGTIDYDSRRRDARIENSRSHALLRLRSLAWEMESLGAGLTDGPVEVCVEDGAALGIRSPCGSTVARELMSLASHTVHHFAVIAAVLRTHGLPVDPDFGKALSTLSYERRLNKGAA